MIQIGRLQPEEELKIHDQVIEPLAYITASTVFTMHEKIEVARGLDARAIEMFPGFTKYKSWICNY